MCVCVCVLWCVCTQVPGLTVMRDVAIAKSEYGERAVTKIQDFQVSTSMRSGECVYVCVPTA